MRERPQVNIRVERDVLDQIDEIALSEHVDRSDMARRLIGVGLSTYLMDGALRDYRRGAISPSRAAEVAGVSLYDMLDRIQAEGIPYEVDADVFSRLDARPESSRVGEDAAGYDTARDSQSGISELRERFKPESVRWLFVGESSPAGGTHFYRANSNLFRAVREAFAQAHGADRVPDGATFLDWFRDQGCWLVDLADHPIDRIDASQRAQAVAHGVRALAELIRQVRPETVVVVKSSIATAVREAIAAAEWPGRVLELPFPVRQWRAVFVAGLARALGASASEDLTPGQSR